MELTKNELQVMAVLWHAGKAMTSSEIRRQSVVKTWKDASIHIILNKLLEKGAVCEYGFVKDGKAIARTFVPSLSQSGYYEAHFAGYAPEDIPVAFSAFLKSYGGDAEMVGKLKAIISEWENEKVK